MDVLLASCLDLPEPDLDAVPLLAALRSAGVQATVRGWDDPDARWDDARMVVLRATWNYPQHAAAFAAWIDEVGSCTTLLNGPQAVRWNLHKRYLVELAAAGVPTTPTVVLERGSTESLAAIQEHNGWDDVVVKPAISAASFRTLRVGPSDGEIGQAHLGALLAERDVLIQPYLTSVEGHGERALVWIDGQLTHAIRKTPRWDGEDESVSTTSVPISAAEEALAHAAVAVALERGDLLYARIDMAPGPEGHPVVMELELIEPSLFFPQGPDGLERYVNAVVARLS
jgi:glutathione synthase/RimK-type ligase-like ATP-grasp enzyme